MDVPPRLASRAATGAPECAHGAMVLTSTGFLMMGNSLVFPASASHPADRSPPLAWSGVPEGTKSLAVTLVDKTSGAVKWVLWDIPARFTNLPPDIDRRPHPNEVPGSRQRGNLGRVGYSGPSILGPPFRLYEFVVWALGVDKLPGCDSCTTSELYERILPGYRIATSVPLVAEGQLGGP